MSKQVLRTKVRTAHSTIAGAVFALMVSAAITPARAQTPRAPTIIESTVPLWTAATALKVDPKPTLTLGQDEPVFATIAGAHRYADGRVVVADSKAKELLMFGADGKFVRKIARAGNGPGEFQLFDELFRAGGDSIGLFDYRSRRITYFGDQGQLLRSTASMVGTPVVSSSGSRSTTYPTPVGRFADGSLLAQQNRGTPRARVSQKITDSIAYLVITDATRSSVGDFFTTESWDFWHTNGDVSFGPSPFARVGAFAVGPQSFYISDGRQFDATEFDTKGAPLRIIRLRRNPSPVTAAHIAEYGKTFHETSREKDAEVIKWMTFPKTLPAFTQLVRDNDGRLWASTYDINPAVSRYEVFGANARWLGTVTFPSNSTLLEAGRDWVLLRVMSDAGEPLVQLHRLVH